MARAKCQCLGEYELEHADRDRWDGAPGRLLGLKRAWRVRGARAGASCALLLLRWWRPPRNSKM